MKKYLQIFIVALLFIYSLSGCESEKSRLEAEKTRLEVEKLKRDAEKEAEHKKWAKETSDGLQKMADKMKEESRKRPDPF